MTNDVEKDFKVMKRHVVNREAIVQKFRLFYSCSHEYQTFLRSHILETETKVEFQFFTRHYFVLVEI